MGPFCEQFRNSYVSTPGLRPVVLCPHLCTPEGGGGRAAGDEGGPRRERLEEAPGAVTPPPRYTIQYNIADSLLCYIIVYTRRSSMILLPPVMAWILYHLVVCPYRNGNALRVRQEDPLPFGQTVKP